MSIVSMKQLLQQAEMNSACCGAFNVGNMEMVMGAVKAAEELNVPIILQVAERRMDYSPLELIGPMMVEAAKHSSVDIAVQLDHGRTEEAIRKALDIGFTSVMYDGSLLSIEENIENTNRICELAGEYGASVECELGSIGGSECGEDEMKALFTRPEDVAYFSDRIRADALAVSIGNMHGRYKGKPDLQFDILEQIYDKTDLPLVLHGGSGISDSDFQKTIRKGIRKVNIATASFIRAFECAGDCIKSEDGDYFGLSSALVRGTYENVRHHIEVFSFMI